MDNPNPGPQKPSHSEVPSASVVPPRRDAIAAGVPTIVVQQGGGRLARLVSWVGWIGFAVCGALLLAQYAALGDYFDTSGGVTERFHSGKKFARKKIAVLSVEGVMLDGEGFVKRQIDRIRKDQDVAAVVLRVNSPGGTVAAADFIYHHLDKLRQERKIPLVVSMGGVAASGGYYVAMAVGDEPKTIFAEPTTTTGSIGVVIPHYDLSGLLARLDIKDDSIATHPRKEMLSMTKPISDDQRELLKSYINESFERFKKVIQQGRPYYRDRDEDLEAIATGEIFTAGQACRHKLVDELGFVEDAIERAAELAGLDKDEVRVVSYRRPPTLLELSGFVKTPLEEQPMRALLDLGTPRAYYLATSLPLLAGRPL